MMRDRFDEFFCGDHRAAIEFTQLSCRNARGAKCFALSGQLAHQSYRVGAGCVETASGQQQIANDGVPEITLQAWNSTEARDQAETKLRKGEARHLVGNDQIAD